MNRTVQTWGKALGVTLAAYVFFVSISLMGSSFKLWKEFSKTLVLLADNPFIALFVGVLATTIVQSSSTVTSMVVAFVGGGAIDVATGVPIVMGANIGTSVTNTFVSIGHVTRRNEFRRAVACATVHDIFNLLAVAVLLPLELMTGFLQQAARELALVFKEMGGLTFTSPIKAITKPVSHWIQQALLEPLFHQTWLIAIAGVLLSGVILFVSLYCIVTLMRSMMLNRIERFFNRYVGAHPLVAMGMGVVVTVIAQSSSITTSMLVPMAGAGIITLNQIFPITLGANLGTTLTALLASFAVVQNPIAAVTISFVHLLFNISGILVFYPIKFLREIPMNLARRIAIVSSENRVFATIYIIGVFYLVPGVLIALYQFL